MNVGQLCGDSCFKRHGGERDAMSEDKLTKSKYQCQVKLIDIRFFSAYRCFVRSTEANLDNDANVKVADT